ncbi:MAG TPA: GntR family transcriptional regulator [Xanthomonadales bacterium]|nr:GntR family transcriptional regulator [Xanthomonadales bacterium]
MPSPPVRLARPRYQQIADELVGQIAIGRYAVGEALPTESALCARFRVSRHTAREALRRLGQLGLVERRQGSGTRVKAQQSPVQYQQFVQSLEELLQYGPTTRLTVQRARRERASRALARQMDVATHSEIVHVSGLRFERGKPLPFATTEIHVVPRRSTDVRALLDRHESVYALIDLFNVRRLSRVEQVLAAETLAAATARKLGQPAGSAALVATRRYFGADGRLFALAVTTHVGDRFAYASVLSRDDGSPGPGAAAWLTAGHPAR